MQPHASGDHHSLTSIAYEYQTRHKIYCCKMLYTENFVAAVMLALEHREDI